MTDMSAYTDGELIGTKDQITAETTKVAWLLSLLGHHALGTMVEVMGSEVPDDGISPENYAALAGRIAVEFEDRVRSDVTGIGEPDELLLAVAAPACGSEFYVRAVTEYMHKRDLMDQLGQNASGQE